MANKSIDITNIQRLCLHDGPGVRTTIFLKGCYLDCPWCCNPETKLSDITYYSYPNNPLKPDEPVSTKWNVDTLFTHLMRDKDFWGKNGGVTFSGGEPLMQAENLLFLLQQLKQNSVHLVMETALYAPYEKLLLIEPYIDLFIVDFKVIDKPYIAKRYQGENFDFYKNLQYLSEAGKIGIIRMVLIDRITTTDNNLIALEQLLRSIQYNELEFLEYHTLGNKKAESLGISLLEFENPDTKTLSFIFEKYTNSKYLKL